VWGGERHFWSFVRIPSDDEEDLRRSYRERLICERTAHINRIKGLLFAQGIRGINVKAHYKTADVSRCSKLRLQTGGGSLDQMIRPMEQRLGDIQAERLRSLQIDYQIKLGGLLDGEITRLVAP